MQNCARSSDKQFAVSFKNPTFNKINPNQNPMSEDKAHRIPVISQRLRSRHKTYFFDVYKNRNGNHYLKLTQSIRDINSAPDNP